MATKGKKAAPSGGKGKKAPAFGKASAAGAPNPMATFEDDDMYQEPIKKVVMRAHLTLWQSSLPARYPQRFGVQYNKV